MDPEGSLPYLQEKATGPYPEPHESNPQQSYFFKTLLILSRILVTRQVINGFRIRWIDLLHIHPAELQLVVTQSYCNRNTS
jgi:hypothetical protein